MKNIILKSIGNGIDQTMHGYGLTDENQLDTVSGGNYLPDTEQFETGWVDELSEEDSKAFIKFMLDVWPTKHEFIQEGIRCTELWNDLKSGKIKPEVSYDFWIEYDRGVNEDKIEAWYLKLSRTEDFFYGEYQYNSEAEAEADIDTANETYNIEFLPI